MHCKLKKNELRIGRRKKEVKMMMEGRSEEAGREDWRKR
jgi:hypothetical protein